MSDWDFVKAERLELADFATTLRPEQFDAQSLCSDWKVRDVLAHVGGLPNERLAQVFGAVLKNGFNLNKAFSQMAIQGGKKSPDDLIRQLRDNAGSTATPPGLKPAAVLADVVVHGQDIRRPLGATRVIPEAHLRLALDTMKVQSPVLGNKKRIANLKLVANDIDWNFGEGPEVRGSGEALLLAMCGRKAAVADLQGPGVSALAAR